MIEIDNSPDISFETLYNIGFLKHVIIDGLDGSGKGTIVDELSSMLASRGLNVLSIELPQYEQPWGQVIKRVLHSDAIDLTLEERMLLYVLNRLETIDAIKKQSCDIYERSNKEVVLLFDRFVTSNVITCAYYSKTHDTNLNIKKLYEFMLESDRYFLESLHLEDFHVVVPQISADLAVNSLMADNTRKDGPDLYENTDVQSIADRYYQILSDNSGNRQKISLVPQIENGIRLSPNTVSKRIIDMMFEATTTASSGGIREKLHISEISSELLGEMYRMLQSGKYPTLANLDPY